MTDQEMADAVVNGLANTHRCECGILHTVGKGNREWANCDCKRGRQHTGYRVYCPCGSTRVWGPVAGWRTVTRNKRRWQKREAELRERIAELEAALAAVQA